MFLIAVNGQLALFSPALKIGIDRRSVLQRCIILKIHSLLFICGAYLINLGLKVSSICLLNTLFHVITLFLNN